VTTIDLNADIGEGYGRWTLTDDDGLLEIITSANVACGFHAGDPTIMRAVCQKAADNGVAIGAHVGYRDVLGFGRRELPTPAEELHVETLYQLGALEAFARRAGSRVSYLKPHGSLYHAASARPEVAEAIVTAMVAFDPTLVLLGAAGTHMETEAARAGIGFASEGFADRAYTDAGTLVPRSQPGAVHHALDGMLAQVADLVLHREVTSITGARVAVEVASICFHGDTPGAVTTAAAARAALVEAGVEIRPFTA